MHWCQQFPWTKATTLRTFSNNKLSIKTHKHHQIKTEDWRKIQTQLGDTDFKHNAAANPNHTRTEMQLKRKTVEIQRKSEREAVKDTFIK